MKIKISSTQQQAKRETAKAWYDCLQRNPLTTMLTI